MRNEKSRGQVGVGKMSSIVRKSRSRRVWTHVKRRNEGPYDYLTLNSSSNVNASLFLVKRNVWTSYDSLNHTGRRLS